MKKKMLFSFIVFLFLISIVDAQQDFNIVSSAKVDLCPCSNQAYNVLLQNTGSAAATYKITKSGKAADWVKITPSEFTLNPKTAANVQVIVDSPCSIKGTADLNIFITSAGLTKSMTQSLNFLACYNYDISFGEIQDFEEETPSVAFEEHENGYEICEESKKAIPVLIENRESYGNTYEVGLTGEEWSRLNAKEFQLQGRQKGILLLVVEPPQGSEGDYKLAIDAVTGIGGAKNSREIDVKVEKCNNINLDIKQEKNLICGGDLKDYDVEIRNDGKFTETLDLNVEGADFASFENLTSIKLNSKEQKAIKLNVNPSGEDSGNFDVRVNASNSNIKTGDSINLEIIERNACYKADIVFDKIIKNQYTHEVFPVSVFNNGIRHAAYNVSIEGPSWASVIPDDLELKPKQKGNINLDINPGEDVPEGTYSILIKAESNGEVYSKNIDVTLKRESPAAKNIKATIRFYQYYIYVLIVLMMLFLIFLRPIKKRIRKIKDNHAKYKIKKQRQRAFREARKARQEEARKRKQEEEARKEKEERKKIEAEKRAEKRAREKERKKFFSGIKPYLIAILILAVLGALIFAGAYFKISEKLPKKPYYALLKVIYGAYAYLYYIIIGIAVVAALFYILNKIKKKKRKKIIKIEKKAKKEIKRKIKSFKNNFTRSIVLVLIALIVLFSVYGKNLFGYIRNFVVLYLYYFIAGLAILIIIIFLVRFYKPVMDFLLEEDKKE